MEDGVVAATTKDRRSFWNAWTTFLSQFCPHVLPDLSGLPPPECIALLGAFAAYVCCCGQTKIAPQRQAASSKQPQRHKHTTNSSSTTTFFAQIFVVRYYWSFIYLILLLLNFSF
jgi:hypothetical protein